MTMRLMMIVANCWLLHLLLLNTPVIGSISSSSALRNVGLEEEMDYLDIIPPSSSPSSNLDYNSETVDSDVDMEDENENENDLNHLQIHSQMDQLVDNINFNLSEKDALVQLHGSNESYEMENYGDELIEDDQGGFGNNSNSRKKKTKFRPYYPRLRDSLIVVIPVTFIFAIIFLIGLVGNVSTCVVIAKNNYMHTATNYYLFSLAVSDLLLLVSGLPQEMYLTWLKWPYVFGEAFCLIRGLAAETSANATVLTITAFTFERYVAICHPLRSHKLSQLSRVIRLVLLIWVLALTLALPQAAQFGVIDEIQNNRVVIKGAWCTIKRTIIPYAFQISIIVFFLIPMTIITALYVLIGLKLRKTRGPNRNHHELSVESRGSDGRFVGSNRHSQSHVIRMLVAICLCFFICWSPFHVQRLIAIYAEYLGIASSQSLRTLYKVIEYTSGILYYVSTCINPILYHIMSHKFRQAFKDTISQLFGHPSSRVQHRTYSSISHHRASRMGVYHNPHHQNLVQTHANNHHSGSRRGVTTGVDMETCINCRQTPAMVMHCKGPLHRTRSAVKSEQPTRLMALLSGRRKSRQNDNIVTMRQVSGSTTIPLSPTTIKSSPTTKVNSEGISRGGKTAKMMFMLRRKKKKEWDKDEKKKEWDPESTMSTVVQTDLQSGRETMIAESKKGMTMSQTSVDSANTNTISNSSLQDVDENEYTGEELAGVLHQLKENMMESNKSVDI